MSVADDNDISANLIKQYPVNKWMLGLKIAFTCFK